MKDAHCVSKPLFIFSVEHEPLLRKLPNDQAGLVFMKLFDHYLTGDVPTFDNPCTDLVFGIIKSQIDKDKPRNYGNTHWNWKGGISSENHKIRTGSEIRAWRKSVFGRDKYTCQHCGQISGKLQAHHIKPFAKFPELRIDIDNGITLCRECHIKVHSK